MTSLGVALKELDVSWHHAKHRPILSDQTGIIDEVLPSLSYPSFEIIRAQKNITLAGKQCSRARSNRAGQKVGVPFGGSRVHSRAANADLSAQQRPIEREREVRVGFELTAEAVNGFRGTLLTALSEVSGGLALRQSLARERARLSNAFSTQKKIEGLYETRFRAGSIDLRSFIEVQERTRQRESALADNQLERLLSEATLYRALGGSPSASSR
ncbi:hypothetical protein [Rhizobium sp. E27B/91]|uniref:hypothetical protein n=1 Tax=Rhizobium sp. E27B/91 TaxID=2819995 RepID=UPI001FFDFDE5|nr:hypothetical protein [Rhizobium sp. E27B/91]